VHDCVQHKWTKVDLTFIHLSWTVGFWTSGTSFHICASCLCAERCGSCSCQPCTAHAVTPKSHICGEHIFWMDYFHRKVPHLFPARYIWIFSSFSSHYHKHLLTGMPSRLTLHGKPSLILSNIMDLSLWSLSAQGQKHKSHDQSRYSWKLFFYLVWLLVIMTTQSMFRSAVRRNACMFCYPCWRGMHQSRWLYLSLNR
jgi:hypothetical protein